MRKITYADFELFRTSYDLGDYPHLRFGQAFMVHFFTNTGLVDSDLFYTTNRGKAVEIMYHKYIEWELI